jgi:hypothetical protein
MVLESFEGVYTSVLEDDARARDQVLDGSGHKQLVGLADA